MNDVGSCQHVVEYKAQNGRQNYEIICSCIVAPNTKDRLEVKAQCCICQSCLTYTTRLHACMSCAYFGCYKLGHIHNHAHIKNHYLAVDVSYGAVYCFPCRDYVYDVEFEAILRNCKRKLCKLLGIKEPYYPWEASKLQLELLKLNPERRLISRNSYLGLRGLLNLGHTCFVNCILQLLIHTPLLRDYFLSGRHKCQQDKRIWCMVCEMSQLFQEFYSGTTTPFVPSGLLCIVWENAEYLAAYEQQDAHEFFLAILNIMHQHLEGEEGFSNDVKNCHCIVHQIYRGKTKINIICGDCGNVTMHDDIFFNLSLGVGNEPQQKSLNTSTHGKSSQCDEESTTLIQCLESYIEGESLKDPHTCASCQKKDKCSMQSTIMKLPILISFHFKRLHQTHKKKTFISFPELLDMTPYTSSFHQNKASSGTIGDNAMNDSMGSDNEYCLFAVVNHEGSIKGGHYTCYIRPIGNQWFKFDDGYITAAHIDDVFSSEVYLLFYHKKVLEYN